MNEQQIRQLIRDEMLKNANSGAPIVPRHTHNDVDSPAIRYANILTSPVYNGTITMTQGTITGSVPNQVITWANYYIPAPSKVSTVQFMGGALNTTASPAIHAMIVGEAELIGGFQYQPGTSNSVTMGKTPVNIIQGSAAFVMTNGAGGGGAGAFSILRNSQGHIAYASDASNNIYAMADVLSFNNNQITIRTAFAANWSLSGLWIVS